MNGEQELLPLHFFMKSATLCREVLHILRASTTILLSPDPNMLMALLDMRVTGLVVCRNSTHMRVLESWLQSEVSALVLDPRNARYHNADLVRKFQAQSPGGPATAGAASAMDLQSPSVGVEGQATGLGQPSHLAAPAVTEPSSSASSEEEDEQD